VARTGFRVVAAGAVILSVVGVIEFLRGRAPEEMIAARALVESAPATDANSVSEREARITGGPIDQLEAPPLARDVRAIPSVASTAPVPREVEELKLRYPVFSPVIEKSEGELSIENEDPLWSPAMESRILGEISQKALGLEISSLQVDCRTTICRVEMVFPQRLLQKKFGGPVPRDTVWTGQQPVGFFIDALDLEFRQPVASGLDESGAPVVIGYVMRSSSVTSQ
jgi:hypothetical protein